MTVRHANRYTMTPFVDTVEHRYIFPYMWPQVVKYFIFRALTVAVLLSCVALRWRIRLLTVGRLLLLLLTGALLKMALLLTVLRVSWKHTRASCQVWVWRPTTWTEPVKKSRQLTITSFKEMLWRFFERPVVGLLPICWLLISILSVTCRGHTCHFHSESRFIQSQSDSLIITVIEFFVFRGLITIRVKLLVRGLTGALTVSKLVAVELFLSNVLLHRTWRERDLVLVWLPLVESRRIYTRLGLWQSLNGALCCEWDSVFMYNIKYFLR